MDKAKAAVENFMHKAGHHDTTVHERVAPAVVQETVNKTRVEEQQTAIDKEVHQDHYHTSIQPVKDREILPEQHQHRMGGVEERHVRHGDEAAIKARLEQERAQFADKRVEGRERVTTSEAPVIAGEHVHHHVHETIQPVVQKEIIQPSVVHTTVPIHEVHHNEAQHHSASALPAVSMNEFRSQGGSLSGREERIDGFQGEPKPVASTLGAGSVGGSGLGSNTSRTGTTGTGLGSGTTGTSGTGIGSGTSDTSDGRYGNTTGTTGTGLGSGTTGTTGSGLGSGRTGTSGGIGSGTTGTSGTGIGSGTTGTTGSGYGNSAGSGYGNSAGTSGTGLGSTGSTGSTGYGNTGNAGSTSSTSKTGVSGAGPHNSKIENKLDPRVDSNEDGRAGIGK